MSEQSSPLSKIADEVKLLVQHIDSLQQTLPLTMLVIELVGKSERKKLEEFEEKNCSVTKYEKSRSVSIPREHYNNWKKLQRRHDQFHLAKTLVPSVVS